MPRIRKSVMTVVAAVAALGFVTMTTVAGAVTTGKPSAQDANYLQTSISGDRFEIIGGRLALRKGTTDQIRALGRRLIKDHSKSLHEAIAEAREDNIKVPQAPTPSMVWELNTVAAMSGSAFDHAYATLEVKDHQQDIEETTFEAQHGSDPSIKRDAKKELPMLKMHLRLSTAAARGA
jgi:putative membrane protein